MIKQKHQKFYSNTKPKVITSFSNVSEHLQEQIKLFYPEGFLDHLIRFPLRGELVSALRFETEEKIYLLKMTKARAQEIIEEDDDYDGNLKDDVKEDFEDKHGEVADMPDLVEEVAGTDDDD
jgi:hypothetical protein